MEAVITTAVVGIVLIVIGIINRTGNINTLHSYHRHRVSEEDRKPFGRAVGLGMLFCGGGCLFFSALHLCYVLTAWLPLVLIASVGLVGAMVVGLVLSIKAIIRYNKGLF